MWATRSHYTTTIVKNYRNSSNCDDSHFQVRTSLRKSDPTSESRATYYYFKAGEGPHISQAEVRILDHRIEINQMSIKCPTLVKPPFFFSRNAHVRKYTINTPYWRHPGKFPRHFWPLSDICRLRKLTFCWRFVLIYENVGSQKCRGNLPGWRIDGDDEMREATCAKT